MPTEIDDEEKTDLEIDGLIKDDTEEGDLTIDDATPLRDRRLQTNPFDFVVSSISSQIDDGSIVLQDQFQRRRVWNDVKSSRLIESLLLNVPIPVCYFAEIDDGAYAVVDGQQRLTAIYRFISNHTPLTGLKIRSDLNKLRFHELPTGDQRLIRNRTIRCIVILKESHPEIRFDVFERLNTATVSLNRQELRNSTYRGTLNTLTVKLTEEQLFLDIRRARTPDKRMKDAELVLRFFAFHFGGDKYRNRFTSHLDNYLSIGKAFDAPRIEEHRVAFIDTIKKAHSIFGANAFRRATKEGGYEAQINSSIYDVVMLSFARLDADLIELAKEEIQGALVKLCTADDVFIDSISRATRDKSRLNLRLERWITALNSLGLECPMIQFGVGQNAIGGNPPTG